MVISQINYLAAVISALAYFALGAIYFNPKVVGSTWMKEHNLSNPTEEDKKSMGKMMAITFIYCIVACIGLNCLVLIIHPHTWLLAAKTGLLASVFAATGIAMSYLYTKKSFKIVAIDSGYHVIGLILASEIQMAFL